MGILNVTPDSFADGGLWVDPSRAVDAALQMEADGADLIDVGGESTRPGAEALPLEQELARVMPVIEALAPPAARADLGGHLQGGGRRRGRWPRAPRSSTTSAR